jgi:hypothetical protein
MERTVKMDSGFRRNDGRNTRAVTPAKAPGQSGFSPETSMAESKV